LAELVCEGLEHTWNKNGNNAKRTYEELNGSNIGAGIIDIDSLIKAYINGKRRNREKDEEEARYLEKVDMIINHLEVIREGTSM